MKLTTALLVGAALTLAACTTTQAEGAMTDSTPTAQADLKAFPAATAGQTRHVTSSPCPRRPTKAR